MYLLTQSSCIVWRSVINLRKLGSAQYEVPVTILGGVTMRVLSLCLFLLSLSAFGAGMVPPANVSMVRLASLRSDKNNNTNYLNVMVDQNHNVVGLFNEDDPGNIATQDTPSDKVFFLNEIESSQGIILKRSSGRNVIYMQGKLNRSTQEGQFTVRYLANGLTGRYDSCGLNLKRGSGTDTWVVYNSNGEIVTDLFVVTWMMGIDTIQGLCPAN